jgi:hypothetical protein
MKVLGLNGPIKDQVLDVSASRIKVDFGGIEPVYKFEITSDSGHPMRYTITEVFHEGSIYKVAHSAKNRTALEIWDKRINDLDPELLEMVKVVD